MKYIKILSIFIIIILLYKLNDNDNNAEYKLSKKEDKLSIFIFIKNHNNIDKIISHLDKNIESVYSDYIHNINIGRDVDFLSKNKHKLMFDKKNIDYSKLFESNNIAEFNYNIGSLLETCFLNNDKTLNKNEYHLRNFLIRFNQYIRSQSAVFNKTDYNVGAKDFIINPTYISNYNNNYEEEFYLMRIEFLDSSSISNYQSSGVDSILTSILNENANLFNSTLFLHNPYSDDSPYYNPKYRLTQYITETSSFNQLIKVHESLMHQENVIFVESMYDYYFENDLIATAVQNKFDKNMDYQMYINSLLDLEEKLVMLQENYLYFYKDSYDNIFIKKILFDLLGNESDNQGYFSKYINSIGNSRKYSIDNINALFIKELELLVNNLNYEHEEFNIDELSLDIKNHLIKDDLFKIRYFVK